MCGWEGRGLETTRTPAQTLPPHAEGRVLRLGNQFGSQYYSEGSGTGLPQGAGTSFYLQDFDVEIFLSTGWPNVNRSQRQSLRWGRAP